MTTTYNSLAIRSATPRRGALSALLIMSMAPAAYAGNDDGVLVGNDAALMAGAVTATIADGSAIWYNPAGLAAGQSDSVDVSASAFVLRTYHATGLLADSNGRQGNAEVTELISVPSALTFLRRIAPGWRIGLGLFVPQYNDFALRVSLNSSGAAKDLTSRWQLSLREQGTQYRGGLGVGGQLSERLCAGFALFGAYHRRLASLQSAVGNDAATGTTVSQAVRSSLEDYSLLGTQLAVGMSLNMTKDVTVGVSLRSPGLAFRRTAQVTSASSQTDVGDARMPMTELALGDDVHSVWSFAWFEPARVRLGIAYKVAGGVVSLDGDIQPGLSSPALDVARTLVWNLRAGARFPVSDHLGIGAGLFTDRGAEPEAASQTGSGPMHFYGGTLGVQFASVRKLDRVEEHDKLIFATTLALRYARGHGQRQGVNVDTGLASPMTLDVNEVSLHIGSGLDF